MWNLSLRNLLDFSPWLKIRNLWWVHISTLQSNHIFEMHSLYTFSRNIPFWCNFQIWWWNILQAVKPGNRGKLSFALPQTTFLWFTLLCCVIVKLFNNNEFICKIDSRWLINWVSAESAVEMYKACLNWITSNIPRINFVRLFWYLPHQTVDDLLVFPNCPIIPAGNTGRGGFWGRKRCTTLKIISNWNVEFLTSFYFFLHSIAL